MVQTFEESSGVGMPYFGRAWSASVIIPMSGAYRDKELSQKICGG